MVTKTTSVSGFHFRFVFYDLDLIENEYNIEGPYLKYGTCRDMWFWNYRPKLRPIITKPDTSVDGGKAQLSGVQISVMDALYYCDAT